MIPTASELAFLFSGTVFGLAGGLSPGPLLTLVVSETLRHGVKQGIRISFAPLLTDLPIVCATILVLSRFSHVQLLMGIISLLGGAFLAYLGYESLSFRTMDLNLVQAKPRSLRKGVIANFLNPSPYMFWFSVGSPIMLKAYNVSPLSALLFVLSFYVLLVGSKVTVALVVGRSRLFLNSKCYIYAIRLLGMVLFIFAIFFLRNSLSYLGIV